MKKTILVASIFALGMNSAYAEEVKTVEASQTETQVEKTAEKPVDLGLTGLMKAEEIKMPETAEYKNDPRLSSIDKIIALRDKHGMKVLKDNGFEPLTIKIESWLENDKLHDKKKFKDILFVVNPDQSYAYSNGLEWVNLFVTKVFEENKAEIIKNAINDYSPMKDLAKPVLQVTDISNFLGELIKGYNDNSLKSLREGGNGNIDFTKIALNLESDYDVQAINESSDLIVAYGLTGKVKDHAVLSVINSKSGEVVSTFEKEAYNLKSSYNEILKPFSKVFYPNAKFKELKVGENGEFEMNFATASKNEILVYLRKNGL